MRYLPLTDRDREDMLGVIGVKSVDELFIDVPDEARLKTIIADLPLHQAEFEVERSLAALAARNVAAGSCSSFLGAGAYRHHVPASVDQLILRGEFLTSYTPYQPEVSQGTLQYLFEFQTQVAMLTGMDVANASMYDGATSCAEAVMTANRVTKRRKALISGNLHPHYRETVETMGRLTGFGVDARAPSPVKPEDLSSLIDDQTSCVVVQNPDVFGHLMDYSALSMVCREKGALLIIAVTEIVSLGLLMSPGDMGADIVVAEGQSLGNGLNFGGPYLGLFACREKYLRQMPGRVCGQTVDTDGRRGFVLTLSAREQHIRREKATSNICTNSGLCALAFTIHVSLLGEAGLTKLSEINHAKACLLSEKLLKVPGVKVLNETFFNEFTLALPKPASDVVHALVKLGVLGGVPMSRFYPDEASVSNLLVVAVTELTTDADCETLVEALKKVCS